MPLTDVPNRQNTHAVMKWTNDGNKISAHHLKHIIEPKKTWNSYEVGNTGIANYPGYPGNWEFLILAVGESKPELEQWLKKREKRKADSHIEISKDERPAEGNEQEINTEEENKQMIVKSVQNFLYEKKTYLCGTIRTNRKGYPKELVQTPAQVRRLARGDDDWLMCAQYLAIYWKDNRVVYYLSSYHATEGEDLTTTRKNKDGTDTVLPATPTVVGYASYMGGVDRLDQNSRMNKSKKSKRWYRKIEVKLRKLALYNAYVLEGSVMDHNEPRKRKRDHLSFHMEVATDLIGTYCGTKKFKRPRSVANDDNIRLDEKSHWPAAAGGKDRVCAVCNKKHRNYIASHPLTSVTDNPFKRTKTTMLCEKCDVPLCCNSRSTCFKDYHTRVYYWQ